MPMTYAPGEGGLRDRPSIHIRYTYLHCAQRKEIEKEKSCTKRSTRSFWARVTLEQGRIKLYLTILYSKESH